MFSWGVPAIMAASRQSTWAAQTSFRVWCSSIFRCCPPEPVGASLANATLALFVDKVGAPGAINIDMATSSRTETGVNRTNAPGNGGAGAGLRFHNECQRRRLPAGGCYKRC
ncbi:exported hypothetical protein [Candidatus Sulfopaludibacter sp. SbA3]|nr:exported hypothetical protein [Candidatus Sulfopaludibacter sp. SbA3]